MRVRLGWACENSQGWWVGQNSRRMAVLLENFSFFSLQSIRERKANRLINVYMSGDPSLWLCNCGHASCVACYATFSCGFLRMFCFYTLTFVTAE